MTQPTLKAIDTAFDGYLFRSRLEARWAVFWKCIGLRYEYEAEGYELDECFYLPDFYLPNPDIFIEVKPQRELEESEILKAYELQKASGKKVIFLVGRPYSRRYVALAFEDTQVHGCVFGVSEKELLLRSLDCTFCLPIKPLSAERLKEAFIISSQYRFQGGCYVHRKDSC